MQAAEGQVGQGGNEWDQLLSVCDSFALRWAHLIGLFDGIEPRRSRSLINESFAQ